MKNPKYIVLEGEEFVKQYGNKFYKITNERENHHGYQYKDGLNIDDKPFNPNIDCGEGGLYFTNLENIVYFTEWGINVREIEILENSKVMVLDNKFKSECLILGKKWGLYEFINQNEEFIKLLVKYKGLILKYVNIQTDEICKLAVQQHGYALKYVKNQTDEICELAVQQNGEYLEYVKNQTDKICKLAVQQNGRALYYVKNQTDEICKLAVQQNGLALYYVKNKTDEIYKLAVQQNGLTLCYIINQTDEICKLAVQQNGESLKYVKNQTDEICELSNQSIRKAKGITTK